MLTLAKGRLVSPAKLIETAAELREALERLRRIEIADEDSPRGRERAELELAICRYLASCGRRIR